MESNIISIDLYNITILIISIFSIVVLFLLLKYFIKWFNVPLPISENFQKIIDIFNNKNNKILIQKKDTEYKISVKNKLNQELILVLVYNNNIFYSNKKYYCYINGSTNCLINDYEKYDKNLKTSLILNRKERNLLFEKIIDIFNKNINNKFNVLNSFCDKES